jgi:hypothetical protein
MPAPISPETRALARERLARAKQVQADVAAAEARAIVADEEDLVITASPTVLSTAMQRHVDRTLAADRKGGEALWEKALAVADARAEAQHGDWGAYLEAAGLKEQAARRLIAIAERGRSDARFRDAIITGWLSFSVAAIAAKADDDLLTNLLDQPTPPTQRQLAPVKSVINDGFEPSPASSGAEEEARALIVRMGGTCVGPSQVYPGHYDAALPSGSAALTLDGLRLMAQNAPPAPPPPSEPAPDQPADGVVTFAPVEILGQITLNMLADRGWQATGSIRTVEEGGRPVRLYELLSPPHADSGTRNRLWKTRAGLDAIIRAPVATEPAPPVIASLTPGELAVLARIGAEVIGERSTAGRPAVLVARTAAGVEETDRQTLRRSVQAAEEWPIGTRVQTPNGPGAITAIGLLGNAGRVRVGLDAPLASPEWVAVAELTEIDVAAAALGPHPDMALAARGIYSMADPASAPLDWDEWRARASALPGGDLRIGSEGQVVLKVGMQLHRELLARWAFVQELIASYERKHAPTEEPTPELAAQLSRLHQVAAQQTAQREAAAMLATGAGGELYQAAERGPLAEILRLSRPALRLLSLTHFGGDRRDDDESTREWLWESLTSDTQAMDGADLAWAMEPVEAPHAKAAD